MMAEAYGTLCVARHAREFTKAKDGRTTDHDNSDRLLHARQEDGDGVVIDSGGRR